MSVGATALGEATLQIEQLDAATDIKTNARLLDDLELAVEAVRAALGGLAHDGSRASGINA